MVGIGFLAYPGVERLRRVDWYHYRPQGWVAGDLSSSDVALAERAWVELERRRKEGRLSAETEARVTEAALAEQGKGTGPASPLVWPMIGYLSDQCAAGRLTDAQKERFFRQIFRVELRVRPRVVAGERVSVHAVATGPGFYDTRWSHAEGLGTVKIGSEEFGFPLSAGGIVGLEPTRTISAFVVVRGSGPQDVKYTLPTVIFRQDGDGAHGKTIESQFDRVLHGRTFVEPIASPENPKLLRDPSAGGAIQAAMSVQIERRQDSSQPPTISLLFKNPPRNVAFDVSVRIGSRVFDVATESQETWCTRGETKSATLVWDELDRIRGSRADVILRSSGRVARQSINEFEIWDGELIFKDVPIEGGG